MEKTLQTVDIESLCSLKYLKSKASIILREVLNLYFIITALYMAVPGMYRLIQILQDCNFADRSSALFTSWLFISSLTTIVVYSFSYFLNLVLKRYPLSLIFLVYLFYTLIIGLGFLAYRAKYCYFLGIWFTSLIAIKVIPTLWNVIKSKKQAQTILDCE